MNRREFVTVLGGATAWPLAAHAQQPGPMRRIGVLMSTVADDPQGQARIVAFQQTLQQLGWIEGRNVQIDVRWGGNDVERARRYAAELVALAPSVIMAAGTLGVSALQRHGNAIPIVFVNVADPVGAGFVDSLAKPGGNLTGFTNVEYNVGTKWLELLREIVPSTTHVGVIRDPSVTASIAQFAAIQSAARNFGIEVIPLGGRNAKEIEHSVTEFARGSNLGLISVATPLNLINRDLIISLAARLRLPAIYPFRRFVADGGLISYGPDPIELHRLAAGYVDRILKGEKPADLPVQASTKFDLVINLKTAKALGLTVPNSVLSRADELIE